MRVQQTCFICPDDRMGFYDFCPTVGTFETIRRLAIVCWRAQRAPPIRPLNADFIAEQ